MQFDSLPFAALFLATYVLMLLLPGVRAQNILLLLASYAFYGAWDERFLILIALSTLVDFIAGQRIARTEDKRRRRAWLAFSLIVNLGMLGVFKYLGFFVESTAQLFARFGVDTTHWHLEIILPVGISFYTFQTLSYTIDVSRKAMAPAKDFVNFALFVSFFPQLVAGPIERAKFLLPQIEAARRITADGLRSGGWLIAWGLFKKLVVADNLAAVVDPAFGQSAELDRFELWVAMCAFPWQLYCDFSAYSDMARGLARLMGFELHRNFELPYLSTSLTEAWRRWHMTLTGWLRDYLYIPLGGNRGGAWKVARNVSITIFIAGIWHGAAWNYVVFSVYHGILLPLDRLRIIHASRPATGLLTRILCAILTFHVWSVGTLIFRASRRVVDEHGYSNDDSLAQLGELWQAAFRPAQNQASSLQDLGYLLLLIAPVLCVQAYQAKTGDFEGLRHMPFLARTSLIAVLLLYALVFATHGGAPFVYFQF